MLSLDWSIFLNKTKFVIKIYPYSLCASSPFQTILQPSLTGIPNLKTLSPDWMFDNYFCKCSYFWKERAIWVNKIKETLILSSNVWLNQTHKEKFKHFDACIVATFWKIPLDEAQVSNTLQGGSQSLQIVQEYELLNNIFLIIFLTKSIQISRSSVATQPGFVIERKGSTTSRKDKCYIALFQNDFKKLIINIVKGSPVWCGF